MKSFKLPLIFAFALVSLILFFIFIWTVAFFSYYSAFLAFLGLLVFIPLKFNNKRYWLIRGSTFLIGIVLLITTIHIPIKEINNRIFTLSNKPRNTSSMSSFSVRDKVGIYGLNLMMGIFASPIYPEISMETLMMVFPAPESGIRTFHSSFAINSHKIRDVIAEFRNDLVKHEGKKKFNFQKRIYWSARDYSLGGEEARYALALNPCSVSLQASKKDSSWIIDAGIKVKCRYPQNAYVTLISRPELKVEEGLFWVLQQAGWLFPYTAEWKFTINSDDDRIT